MTMFREPWFSIVEVHEGRGRAMADIAAEVAAECGIDLSLIRGPSRIRRISAARHAAFIRICNERPDLSSSQVARYFNREGSSVRHVIQSGMSLQMTTRIWTAEEREEIAVKLRCGATVREIADTFGIPRRTALKRIRRDKTLARLAA